MNKTFKYAGTSVKNGATKVRWAQDEKRVAALEKDGQTDVVLAELPVPMSKLHAVKYISTLAAFGGVEQQTAIAEYLAAHDDGSELVIEYAEEQATDTQEVEASDDSVPEEVEEYDEEAAQIVDELVTTE